jgi:peptidoglycan/LPS O-acetylase OafA/YrhL
VPVQAASKNRLEFLDVARGLAALMVVLEHGLEQCWPGYLEWSLPRINLGQTGVLLFFVISGFIIPASLEQGGSQSRFWLRRCFRLFPLYWTVIALVWLTMRFSAVPIGGVPLDQPGEWLVNLTMLQGFTGHPHVLGVFWTLHFELMIYAACSVFGALRLLNRPATLALVVLGVYVIDGLQRPLLTGKPFFIGGRMFYYLAPFYGATLQSYVSGRLGKRQVLGFLILFAAAITGIWAVNRELLEAEQGRHSQIWRLLGNWLIAYGGFALLMAGRQRLQPATLAWAGRVSYSVYLVHPLVLAPLMLLTLPGWLFLPALFAGTLALSALTFALVENPGIRFGRALEKKWWPNRTPLSLPTAPARKSLAA